MTNKPEALTRRWKTREGQARLQAVIAAVQNGKPWEKELRGFTSVEEIPGGRDLRYASLSEMDLRNADFQNLVARKALFIGTDLSEANLTQTDCSFASFIGACLDRADLSHADFRYTILQNASFNETKMREIRLEGANLAGASLKKADLTDAELPLINLEGCNLRHAKLRRVVLGSVKGNRADFSHADLRGAQITDSDFRYAKFCNASLRDVVGERTDFSYSDFTGASRLNAMLAPLVSASDIWPVKVNPREIASSSLFRGVPGLVKSLIRELLKMMPCDCGGQQEVEIQKFLYDESIPQAHYFAEAKCVCSVCGRERDITFDVTQVMNVYGERLWLHERKNGQLDIEGFENPN